MTGPMTANGPADTGDENYAFSNALQGQRERLRALEAVFDRGSTDHLKAAGMGRGARCLEVGAGGGSVAAWMAEQVGSDGEVLAVDLDTSVAAAEHRHPALTFRDADVLIDQFPDGHFDFAHARLLVAWLSNRRQALSRMIHTIKPGGLLIVESLDFSSVTPVSGPSAADTRLFKKVLQIHLDVLRRHNGFDYEYGRRLPGELDTAGLLDVDAAGAATMWRGGESGMRLWQLTFAQLRSPIVAAGIASAELDRVIAMCSEPSLAFIGPLVMTAWGRRGTS